MEAIRSLFAYNFGGGDHCNHEDHIVRNITTWLKNVDLIEQRHKQAQDAQVPGEHEQSQAMKIRQLRNDSINGLKFAFSAALNEVTKAKIDPTCLPKEVALQLAEILCRYGIKCYADNDLSHPFQCSLNILQAGLLMQQYALGLSDRCPDLSNINTIDDLYQLEHQREPNAAHVNFMMDKMVSKVWAERASELSPAQLVTLSKTLRYINGCIRNIEPSLMQQDVLIKTAVACLKAGAHSHPREAACINNELAEVKYNDLTGILKAKAEMYRRLGEHDLAEEAIAELRQQWDECVKLSEDPDLMLSRCTNKRFFFEQLPPEQELIERNRALEIHLARPKECQRPILIALAWHNLSMFHQQHGNMAEAVRCVNEALKVTSQCLAHGENNVDLVKVRQNAERLAEMLKI